MQNAYGSAVIAASESNLADPDIVSQWSAQSGTKYAGFSTTVDQKHLNRYTKTYKAEQDTKFKANAEKRRVKLGELTDDKRGWLLNLSWKSYLALLKVTPDELDERLTILSDTLNIMNAANHHFTDISQTNDRLASADSGLLWRGDFHHARQLLQAISARIDDATPKPKTPPTRCMQLGRLKSRACGGWGLRQNKING